MALEVGLQGREEGWSPADAGERKGRVWEQEEAGGWGETSGPSRLADTGLTEEDNDNQGLANNKASHCWFPIVAQTNHYTSWPTASCGSQVPTNPQQEAGEAS